jgi:methionine sulfoxide reductase heme-binding subunit
VKSVRVVKPFVFLAGLLPVAYLAYGAVMDTLGADPIAEITHQTGDWTLRLLAATLLITPLRRLTGWNWLIRYRRMIGLFAFFYGSLHFLTYVWLDQFFAWHDIVKDVAKRPFITVGFSAFVLLIPLAVTSTTGWIRRLGGKRWNLVHRLVYVSASLGVIHYYWLVKADTTRPVRYGMIIGTLLAARVIYVLRRKWAAAPERRTSKAAVRST